MPLIVTLPRWASKEAYSRARTLEVDWPKRVQEATWLELQTSAEDRVESGVYAVSGKPYSKRLHRAELGAWRTEQAAALVPDVHPARDLIDFLNHQSPRVFQKLVQRNLAEARRVASALERSGADGQLDPERTQRVRQSALRLLHHVEQDPMPLYKPSQHGTTARIFPHGRTYLGLPKEVRRTLTAGSAEFDLTNCQLAIAAKEWQVPEVQAFLETGEKIWPELAAFFEVDVTEHKPVFKAFLYALLFGMKVEYRKGGEPQGLVPLLATGVEGGEAGKPSTRLGPGVGWDQARRWMEHPLLSALYAARERRLREIRADGTVTTCFGTAHPSRTEKEARSALAAQMQAIELSLLLPAFEFVRGQRDLTIVAWQHDGFTLHSSDQSKLTSQPGRRGYVERLCALVNARTQARGYATRLEGEVILPVGSLEASLGSASRSAPSLRAGVQLGEDHGAAPPGVQGRAIESYPAEADDPENAVLDLVEGTCRAA